MANELVLYKIESMISFLGTSCNYIYENSKGKKKGEGLVKSVQKNGSTIIVRNNLFNHVYIREEWIFFYYSVDVNRLLFIINFHTSLNIHVCLF